MSVKKLGKAILGTHWFLGSEINYSLPGSEDRFTVAPTPAMQQELNSIGTSPRSPHYKYGTPAEKEAYEKKRDEYNAKREEVFKKVCDMIQQETSTKPLRLYFQKGFTGKKSDLVCCIYKETIYKFDRASYSDDEMLLQIMELEDKERIKFERLKHRYSEAEKVDKEGQRLAIPEEVRIAVWRRDEGKCVKCSSRENLEYDHIIPISKGGSTTVRNIELLCEKCNREKKDNIV